MSSCLPCCCGRPCSSSSPSCPGGCHLALQARP
jgi:hypothetical protein